MASFPKFIVLFTVSALLFCTSCEKESEIEEILRNPQIDLSDNFLAGANSDHYSLAAPKNFVKKNYFLKSSLTPSGRSYLSEPIDCVPTKMLEVLFKYLTPIARDELATENFNYYQYLSYHLARTDNSPQYFGAKGEFTSHVKKIQRDLERFWNMSNMVAVKGQHSESLNDREKLADVLFYYLVQDLEHREEAYPYVDQILELNRLSPNLPESPLFAADGFSQRNGVIVVGDGLVQMISETGIEPKVTWTGVLAHEWAHQIQMNNYLSPDTEETPGPPMRELEADFFAGYYLTHKRGAAYNWKKAEQFFELFFNLGDCSIETEIHHGTPPQRMEAARLGYELAMEAQKKGHILSAQEVHEYFLKVEKRLLI